MQPRLTFARLAHLLEQRFSCTKIRLLPPEALTDPAGVPTPAVFAFVRQVGNAQHEAIVHVYDDSWPVMDDMLRYICDRLQIDINELGQPQ